MSDTGTKANKNTINITSIVNSITNSNTGGVGGSNAKHTITVNYDSELASEIKHIQFISTSGKTWQPSTTDITDSGLKSSLNNGLEPGTYAVGMYNGKGKNIASGKRSFIIKHPTASLSETGGKLVGGTSVVLSGEYLANASNVFFGSAAANDFVPANNTDTDIKVSSPASLNTGAVDVKVAFPGTSSTYKVGTFSYADPQFTVSGFYPNFASSAGATVTIYGSGFNTTNVESLEVWNSALTDKVATIKNKDIAFAPDGNSLSFMPPSILTSNTSYNLALVATNNSGTVYVNDNTPGNPSFCFVDEAVVSATKIYDTSLTNGTDSSSLKSLIKGNTLPVYSTGDFPSSGDLFVQTTKGVAILSYTGVKVNKSVLQQGYYTGTFTGVTFCDPSSSKYAGLGDFDADTSGLVLANYASVFAANSDAGFEFKITLPEDSTDLGYIGYYSSSVPTGEDPAFYVLQTSSGTGSWHKTQVSTSLSPTTLNGGENKLALPVVPTNSANFIFTSGSYAPPISTNDSGGVNRPSPYSAGSMNKNVYDFLEFTLDGTAGDAYVSLGTRLLPKLTIDTSQVDQLGLPIRVTTTADRVIPITLTTQPDPTELTVKTVGVDASFSMSDVYADYNGFLGSDSAYASTLVKNPDDTNSYLRIASPGDVLSDSSDGSDNALNWVFDKTLHTLFTSPSGGKLLLNTGNTGGLTNAMFKGVATTVNNLKVLQFSCAAHTEIGPLNVYMPLFKNNKTGAPDTTLYQPYDAPSWLTSGVSSGAMVFNNDGVFTDYTSQTGLTSVEQEILGNIENQLVVAINRGCALLSLEQGYSNHTEMWLDPQKQYPVGYAANKYAQFMHTYTDTNSHKTIFEGVKTPFKYGFAYALAYDDQGGLSTTMTVVNNITDTGTYIG